MGTHQSQGEHASPAEIAAESGLNLGGEHCKAAAPPTVLRSLMYILYTLAAFILSLRCIVPKNYFSSIPKQKIKIRSLKYPVKIGSIKFF